MFLFSDYHANVRTYYGDNIMKMIMLEASLLSKIYSLLSEIVYISL